MNIKIGFQHNKNTINLYFNGKYKVYNGNNEKILDIDKGDIEDDYMELEFLVRYKKDDVFVEFFQLTSRVAARINIHPLFSFIQHNARHPFAVLNLHTFFI